LNVPAFSKKLQRLPHHHAYYIITSTLLLHDYLSL